MRISERRFARSHFRYTLTGYLKALIILCVFVCCSNSGVTQVADGQGAISNVVTTVAQYQKLKGNQTSENLPFSFEGLIIWADITRNVVLLKDSTGIVEVGVDLRQYPAQSGQRVRAEGVIGVRRAHFPEVPSGSEKLRMFEKSYNEKNFDQFVSRTRGFLHPPQTGQYVIWVSGDDHCELRLSTDDNPANSQVIASANDWTRFRQWEKSPSQKSKPLFLEAGKRYFVELLHVNHVGDNNFAVAWQGPDLDRTVVHSRYLSPWSEREEGSSHPSTDPVGYLHHEYWTKIPGANWELRPSNLESLKEAPPAEEGAIFLNQTRLQVLGEWAKPEAIKLTPERFIAPDEPDYQWVEFEGEVTFASEGEFSSVLEVSRENRPLQVCVGNPRTDERLRGLLGASIRARGFCQTAIDEAGNRVVSRLWVPSPEEIELRDPVAGGWTQVPPVSLLELTQKRSAMLDGQRVRLEGEILKVDGSTLQIRETGTAHITAFISSDGKNWVQVGNVDANPGPSSHVGFAVSAHDNGSLTTAKITNLSGPSAEWKSMDVGNPGRSGSSAVDGTGYLIQGGGADVWDDTQQFHYLYQPLTKSGTVIARVESLAGSHPWSKAGIMIRKNLSPAGGYVFAAITPENGAAFQYRIGDNGRSGTSRETAMQTPCWIKLAWEMDENTLTVKTASEQHSLKPGEIVEVVGVLEWMDQRPILKEAFCRTDRESPGPTEIPSKVQDDSGGTLLTTARSVQQLPLGELQRGHLARIRGVVTMKHRWGFIVQDETGGIYINGEEGYIDDVAVGQYVEIDGATIPGGFSPAVRMQTLKIHGLGRLPAPLRASPRHIMASRRDCQWVEMRGIVRNIHRQEMELLVDGTAIRARFNEILPDNSLDRFLGANVRLRGATAALFNSQRQLLGLELHIPSLEFVSVERAARKDPFGVPTQAIRSLAQFNVQGQLARHVKIAGTVTFAEGNTMFLQDATGGVRLRTKESVEFLPGTMVEAAGLLETEDLSILLIDTLVKDEHRQQPLKAIQLQEYQLPNLEHDAKLLTITGGLVNEVEEVNGQLVFQLQNGPRIFKASLPAARAKEALPRVGSLLAITGVCQLRRDEQVLESSTAGDLPFDIYVSTQSDIRLLKSPPLWTARRIIWAAGTLGAVSAVGGILLVLLWRKNILLRRAQAELLKTHDELESRVAKRTEELASANNELRDEILERKRAEAQVEQVQQQLLHASRQAGMAEIATSVLHNVGNVLNSVNVSASVVADKMRTPVHSGLSKIASVLQENEADLATFLSGDANGKRIPQLLAKISEYQSAERAKLNREMQELTKGLDHIKQIVSMQQSYARAGGILEQITPQDLVEDAIRWNASSFERHQIKIVRAYEDVPPLLVEKHKALQILVNLLRNAKHACEEAVVDEKRITIQLSSTLEERIRITVNDNGVGIEAENLTRIFAHGFTTRKNGHGFGLHSGAITAKQMGGQLTAASPGLGLGASFVLELPLRPPQGE